MTKLDGTLEKQTEWFKERGYEWDGKFWVKIRKVKPKEETP